MGGEGKKIRYRKKKQSRKMEGGEISRLPDGCIAHILSLTSPKDACRAEAVSPEFRSIAQSDTVWERLLPSNYRDIVRRSNTPLVFSNKKELYLALSKTYLIIDQGKRFYKMERSTGKYRYEELPAKVQPPAALLFKPWPWSTLTPEQVTKQTRILQEIQL